ncbi:MAG: hypothetical protein K2X39_09370 [Silvanigrellaceae bacterium]|nr:hypothetical protein [Silvanigrellaceae bacterium]
MSDLFFSNYLLSFTAGMFASLALSLLGIQLMARDRAVESLCTAQGAAVGILCAMLFAGVFSLSEVNVEIFCYF